MSQSYDDRIANGPKECGNQLAYIYFMMFIIVIHTMMMNLFMAVVLEGYCSTNKEHTGAITQEILSSLVEHWVDYDP